jgi:hypothetical protein
VYTQQNGTIFPCRLRKIGEKTTPALDFAEMRIIDLASENHQRRSSGVPVVGAAALGKMIIPVRCFTCGKVSSRGWELLGRAGAVGWGGEGRGEPVRPRLFVVWAVARSAFCPPPLARRARN